MTIGDAIAKVQDATLEILKEYGYDTLKSERDAVVALRVVHSVGEAFQRTLVSNPSPESRE